MGDLGLLASTRDATSYNYPRVTGPKRAHIALNESRTRAATAGDGSWFAACDGALLVEDIGMRASDVAPILRCRRAGCRERWPEVTGAVHG